MPSLEFRRVLDRKSTRLNSSHGSISYAVFCLKKKNITTTGYPGAASWLDSSHYCTHAAVSVWLSVVLLRATRRRFVASLSFSFFFFFNNRAPPGISPFPLPAPLPI